jgi:ElaB/YqjD/DUF883 family membrane-anchored ribosome-binding protein
MYWNYFTFNYSKMPGVLELSDEIEQLLEEKPDKRKKKEYQEWKLRVNELIKQVNALSKFKMYNIVK